MIIIRSFIIQKNTHLTFLFNHQFVVLLDTLTS